MMQRRIIAPTAGSLPSRERGLKLFNPKHLLKAVGVAPFAGAWIEITASAMLNIIDCGRSLRGSVD